MEERRGTREENTTVTLSDCGRALESIEREIVDVEQQAVVINRKLAALRTQHLMIHQLARTL